MIQYKGIQFQNVDQLIDYQVKAEGLKLPNNKELPPLPETTLLEGLEDYLKKSPPPFSPGYPHPTHRWSIPCHALDPMVPRAMTNSNMHCRKMDDAQP